MKKTVLLAATATLSAGLIGLAAAASAGGPSSGSGDVSPASATSTTELRHGADDPLTHDVGDDHGSAGQGADDVVPSSPTVRVPVPTPAPAAVSPTGGRNGADDPASHDVGDDHGGRHGGHGADD